MQPQPDSVHYRRRYAVLYAVMVSGIISPIAAGIINAILPTITQSLQAEISTSQWVPMIYLLAISSLLLFYGRLGDIVGYKKVYIAGLGGFIAASALCGAARSIYTLIAFRALQGVFGGMMMAVPYAIITACFPPHERGKALGINALSISAGLALGPSLGGLIAFAAGWRFAFLINVPIGVVGLLWALRVVPDLRGHESKLDVAGAVLAFATLASFLLFINRAQAMGLNHRTWPILITALVAGSAFVWLESRLPYPMLNLSLFRNPGFSLGNMSALLNFMSQYVMVFITPFFLQRLLHQPPNRIGLVMTAFPLAVMTMAPASGALSDRIGARVLASVGTTVSALALLLMSLLSADATVMDIAWRMVLFGLGTGIFQSPNNSCVMGSAPRQHLGSASGALATTRNIGMTLGIAVGGWALYSSVHPEVLRQPVLDVQASMAFLAGVRHAYLAGAALAALAALTSLGARGRKHASDGLDAERHEGPGR